MLVVSINWKDGGIGVGLRGGGGLEKYGNLCESECGCENGRVRVVMVEVIL